MVPNSSLINVLRDCGYTFNDRSDRMEIWKKKGSTHRVFVRRHNAHDPEYAATVLRQAGFPEGELMKFLANYDNVPIPKKRRRKKK